MKLQRAILEQLSRDALKHIADDLELDGVDRRSVTALRQALARARRATPQLLLEPLGEADVKAVCEVLGISPVGRRGQLIQRLLAQSGQSGPSLRDGSLRQSGPSLRDGSRTPDPATPSANQPETTTGLPLRSNGPRSDGSRTPDTATPSANQPALATGHPLRSNGPRSGDATHIDRMLEVLRRSPLLRLEGNRTVQLHNVRPPARGLVLSAEALVGATAEGQAPMLADLVEDAVEENKGLLKFTRKPVAFVFGPENGAVSERLVFEAAKETYAKSYTHLYVIGFAIQPHARQLIERSADAVGIAATYVQATPDLLMGDLLKNMRSSQILSVCGQPDGALRRAQDDRWQVELRGLDVFDPRSGERVDGGQGVEGGAKMKTAGEVEMVAMVGCTDHLRGITTSLPGADILAPQPGRRPAVNSSETNPPTNDSAVRGPRGIVPREPARVCPSSRGRDERTGRQPVAADWRLGLLAQGERTDERLPPGD